MFGRGWALQVPWMTSDSTKSCDPLEIGVLALTDTARLLVSTQVSVSCGPGLVLAPYEYPLNLTCQTDGTWSRDITLYPCRCKSTGPMLRMPDSCFNIFHELGNCIIVSVDRLINKFTLCILFVDAKNCGELQSRYTSNGVYNIDPDGQGETIRNTNTIQSYCN